jgi:hypothetical protein
MRGGLGLNDTDKAIKTFLLTWLIEHGRDVVWSIPVKHYSGEQWDLLGRCIRFGYIDSLQDPFSRHFSNKLTDAGLEFLNEQRS